MRTRLVFPESGQGRGSAGRCVAWARQGMAGAGQGRAAAAGHRREVQDIGAWQGRAAGQLGSWAWLGRASALETANTEPETLARSDWLLECCKIPKR